MHYQYSIPKFQQISVYAVTPIYPNQEKRHIIILMEKYPLKEKLGEGSYGVVWKASRGDTTYAVKVIQGVNFFRKDEVQSEISIMKKLSHPNLVRIHESSYDEASEMMFIVMDYCQNGDLLKYVSTRNGDISQKEILQIFRQLVDAFQFMSSKGVIHRDLKPQNVLVTTNGSVKIADFGCARNLHSDQISKLISMSIDKGTPCFASPQLLMSQPYSYKCDVWSVGVIIYYLTFRKLPFFSKKVSQIISSIRQKLQNRDIQIPAGQISEEIKYILRRCLKYREVERATWREFTLCRIFNAKIHSIKAFCEYAKNISNIANWISKMFWKERKMYKIKEGKDQAFVFFIIKFQLSILQLGQRVMQRHSEWRYMFDDQAWTAIDVDDSYYKHYKQVHLKQTNQYFNMLRDCPKSEAANKVIKQKQHNLFLPFADLQNSIRCAGRVLAEISPLLQPKHHKVMGIMGRWMNFQRYFEMQKKPSLQRIIAQKMVNVGEQVTNELSKSQIGFI